MQVSGPSHSMVDSPGQNDSSHCEYVMSLPPDGARLTLLDVRYLIRRRPSRAVSAAVLAGVAGLLAGCSGSGSGASTALAEATQPAKPGAPCDKQAFSTHVALAVGSVQAYVWKPYVAGAFATGAKARPAALATGAGASALAARELAAAKPLVAGCSASIPLVNALTTGASLAHAASVQLAAGRLNKETVAGVNSISSTVLSQAAGNLGVRITPAVPTRAEVGAAG